MSTRRPDLLRWQWEGYAANHRDPTNLLLHLLAIPLFLFGTLLLVVGLFSLHLLMAGLGLIGIVASLALQRHGHQLEEEAPAPFADRRDAVLRLLAEQFITFPRFVLSGQWLRAWRARR